MNDIQNGSTKKTTRRALLEFLDVSKVLLEDLVYAYEQVTNTPSDFWLRTFVRTFFAYVEGVTYQFKQLALVEGEALDLLDDIELSLLKEKTIDLDERGEVDFKPIRFPLLKNVRFAFNVVIKVFFLNLEIDYGSNGWKCFQDAYKVRNRITHPKFAYDLKISTEKSDKRNGRELEVVSEAFEWYTDTVDLLYEKMMKYLDDFGW